MKATKTRFTTQRSNTTMKVMIITDGFEKSTKFAALTETVMISDGGLEKFRISSYRYTRWIT